MKIRLFSLSLLLSLFSLAAFAQPAPDTTRSFTVTGYLDGYYGFDFGQPASGSRPYLYNASRQNEFSVNVGMVDAKYTAQRVRARFALGTGTYFAANYAAEPSWAQYVYEGSVGSKLFENSEVWLDLGVLPSPYGYEGAISKDQLNLTRSFSAENSPYYLGGAKLTGTFGKLTAAIFVINGWQNIQETNTNKSLGTQLQYKASDKWLFNWSTYYGDLPSQTDNSRKQFFSDLYVSYTPNSSFQAIALFDFGIQEQTPGADLSDATWHTANITARYWLTDKLGIGGRAEYYTDTKSAIIAPVTATDFGISGFSTYGGSLNLDWRPASNILLRLEGRSLSSSKDVYIDADGAASSSNFAVTCGMALTID